MTDVSKLTAKALALYFVPGVGATTIRQLACLSNFGDASGLELCAASPRFKRAISGLADIWSIAQQAAERQIQLAAEHGARIISKLDVGYPTLLAASRDDPFLLFVKGQLPSHSEKALAIVGTRQPTHHGSLITTRITEFVVGQGWSVVSGLAVGCDTLAHQTAIDLGGHTSAVLAHGLHTIAPKQNQSLARAILDSGGALVTEFPFGSEAKPQHFVRRDLTQAGLSQGVIMVQSDLDGGSLHASRASLAYGRWLAVPVPTKSDISTGAPKVRANQIILNGSEQERVVLLKCNEMALARIIPLRSKEDYPQLTGFIDHSPILVDACSAPRLSGPAQNDLF